MAEIKNELELYSRAIRGNQRRKVITVLSKPKIPTEIKKEAQMSITNVSKILRAFNEKGLIQCLNPNSWTGKIYQLTDRGNGNREKMLKK